MLSTPQEMTTAATAYSDKLHFFVNGKLIDASAEEPDMFLLDFLRLRLGLTGAKLGCGEVRVCTQRVTPRR